MFFTFFQSDSFLSLLFFLYLQLAYDWTLWLDVFFYLRKTSRLGHKTCFGWFLSYTFFVKIRIRICIRSWAWNSIFLILVLLGLNLFLKFVFIISLITRLHCLLDSFLLFLICIKGLYFFIFNADEFVLLISHRRIVC